MVLQHTSLDRALRIAEDQQIRGPLEAGLKSVPEPIRQMAQALANAKPELNVTIPGL